MPLKPKKISTDNIMKSLENAGIVIEKYDSPIPMPKGKIPVVFEDGTEAFIDLKDIELEDLLSNQYEELFKKRCEFINTERTDK